MATVTGYTAEKMDEIVDDTVESATVNGVGHLILNKHGGGTVDAGSVIGPPGPAGSDATALRNIGELAISVWELEAKVLAQDNGMVDWLGDPFVPGINHIASRTLDGFGYPILNIFRDPDRDQGFIGIDDLQVGSRFKGNPITNTVNGLGNSYGHALSPDKKWYAAVSGTSLRVLPVDANGIINNDVMSIPAPTTLPQNAANSIAGQSIKFTPDGKAIIVALSASPYIAAYAFNTVTGVIGAKAADPASLPATAPMQLAINANSSYVALAGSESASPFFTVYAYNSTTNAWGAKSAAPATPPTAVTYGIAFSDAGDYLFVTCNGTTLLRAYAFNNGTGVIGASTDAPSTPTFNVGGIFQRAGKVIMITAGTPFIHGWNFAAGVWSAKWANPASLPTGQPGLSGICINDDASGVMYYDGNVNSPPTPQVYLLNASSFGAKVTPTNNPSNAPSPGNTIPWPIEVRSDFLTWGSSTPYPASVWGDAAGTTSLTGQATTITKTMPASCQSVLIVDSFSKSSINVTRQYDVSLDGGTSWNNNVPVNTVVLLPTPGTQLKVRITVTRTALGQTGQIFWFNVWAG